MTKGPIRIEQLSITQNIPETSYLLFVPNNGSKLERLPIDKLTNKVGESTEYTFSSPSDTWIINHNLGYVPVINITTIGGVEMDGDVHHVSTNQTIISFNAPVIGKVNVK